MNEYIRSEFIKAWDSLTPAQQVEVLNSALQDDTKSLKIEIEEVNDVNV